MDTNQSTPKGCLRLCADDGGVFLVACKATDSRSDDVDNADNELVELMLAGVAVDLLRAAVLSAQDCGLERRSIRAEVERRHGSAGGYRIVRTVVITGGMSPTQRSVLERFVRDQTAHGLLDGQVRLQEGSAAANGISGQHN